MNKDNKDITVKTAMQKLIEHIELDKRLEKITEEYAKGLLWYIDTYFMEFEKAQIQDAFEQSKVMPDYINAELYYNETFKNEKQKEQI